MFWFIVMLFLALAKTASAPPPKPSKRGYGFTPHRPSPYASQFSPYTLQSMYGYTPKPKGMDWAVGRNFGKIIGELEDTDDEIYPSDEVIEDNWLNLDFYFQTCPNVEDIVHAQVKSILATDDKATPQLLRLFFHDCFIEGCDASVLLTGDGMNQVERDTVPNQTLKGFEFIEMIKMELEKECPGVVSCADILALSTRDSISLSGGPFYPVLTGRRDSRASFFGKAAAEIPTPFDNINKTLSLFSQRGFTPREIVTLLGAHNIGRINCTVIVPRLKAIPSDPFISPDFGEELNQQCQDINNRVISPESPDDGSSPSQSFGPNYYSVLMKERGLLFSDMQLMTTEETATAVMDYASDVDGTTFLRDFVQVMIKMSNLQPLIGSQGEIRNNCSLLN